MQKLLQLIQIQVIPNEKTYHQLALVWNVFPILLPAKDTINDLLEIGIEKLEKEGYLEKGDKVIIAGGSQILPTRKNSKTIGGVIEIQANCLTSEEKFSIISKHIKKMNVWLIQKVKYYTKS